MEFEQIETKRLFLKMLTPEKYAELFNNYPDPEIMKVMGLQTQADLDKQKKKVKGGFTTYDRSIRSFLLVLKDTGETIGRGGFHNWFKDDRRAEIGYQLTSETHKRKGYMSEALAAIIAHGFSSMDLNRIEAYVGTDNVASLSLMKKYKFTREGCLRQHRSQGSNTTDSFVFSLLKEEY